MALHDSDEEPDSLNDTSGGGAATDIASSVPLKYERRLQKMKELAKQMPDSQFTVHLSFMFIYMHIPSH